MSNNDDIESRWYVLSFQNEIKASSQIREVEKRPRPRADLYNATQSDHHEMVTNK